MNGLRWTAPMLIAVLVGSTACRQTSREFRFPERQIGPHEAIATQIEYPDVASAMDAELAASLPPRATENPQDQEPLDLSLAEAVQLAMIQNEVIRGLGGSVVTAPGGAQTVFQPALVESDPRASVEAALSAFDAQLTTSVFWNKIDRPINQTFTDLFPPFAQQLGSNFLFEVNKATATGARFAVRNHVLYDRNEIFNPSLSFNSAYQVDYEAEYRQPLLQGAGVEFNRIAGPNSQAGGAGGVLLARINMDVSLADFEAGVTGLVRDVEQAYWDLYFAYRDLDAKLQGRDSALVAWRNIAERLRIGLRGGTPENEAQLRSQYFTFQAAVDDAVAALYTREERLRYLLGMTPNGPQLIRPSCEPPTVKLVFPWQEALGDAHLRRVELRRQKWQIKRRELELIAARNYLKPRLDAVALYRWRGLGDHLLDLPGPTGYESAFQNLTTGDFQEWQLGVQMDVPIGFRREFAAVRNAELQLARDRAVLKEQEFRVSHDLSEAMRSMHRAFQLMKSNLNRRVAAQNEVDAMRARFETGFEQLDVYLQAQRRLAESDSAYYRSQVDYALAIRDIHYAKGTLLEYDGVSLAEGPWSTQAYRDALQRSRHFAPHVLDYGLSHPRPISRGAYRQHSADSTRRSEDDGNPWEPITTPPGTPLPTPGQFLDEMD